MMPQALALAEASQADGVLNDAFHALESREAMVGASNVLPLLCELVMGAFRPRLLSERRVPA